MMLTQEEVDKILGPVMDEVKNLHNRITIEKAGGVMQTMTINIETSFLQNEIRNAARQLLTEKVS